MATVYEQRQYTESDAAKKWREQMQAQMAAKPADYQSQYRPQIDKTIDSIVNRKDFQYDVNGDALWNQYKDRYVNLGQQAMMDTMGQAAQLTGGYGNSYAQMAGQQAYQGYLQGLTDKIPELANMALDRYNQQGQDLYQRYGLLSGEDQMARDQWLAGYNQWLTERDWLANQYNTERGFDYGTHRDSVADDQWKAQFDEDIRRFDFANKLGEFAPVAGAGGFGGYYYGGNPNPKPQDTADTGEFIGPYNESYMADLIESGQVNASINSNGNLILNTTPTYTGKVGTTTGGNIVQPNNVYTNGGNMALNTLQKKKNN